MFSIFFLAFVVIYLAEVTFSLVFGLRYDKVRSAFYALFLQLFRMFRMLKGLQSVKSSAGQSTTGIFLRKVRDTCLLRGPCIHHAPPTPAISRSAHLVSLRSERPRAYSYYLHGCLRRLTNHRPSSCRGSRGTPSLPPSTASLSLVLYAAPTPPKPRSTS